MALGDVYEIRLHGEYLSQVIFNVFHYQSSGSADVTDPILTIAAAIGTYLVTAFTPFQVDGFQWLDTYAKHLVEGGTEATHPFAGGQPGIISDQGLPAHDCFAFRLNRTLTTTRHGQKRLAGIAEGSQENGVAVSGVLTALGVACAAMAHAFDSGDGFSTGAILKPVIYSTVLNGELRAVPVANPVGTVQYVRISTQNTRKVYS